MKIVQYDSSALQTIKWLLDASSCCTAASRPAPTSYTCVTRNRPSGYRPERSRAGDLYLRGIDEQLDDPSFHRKSRLVFSSSQNAEDCSALSRILAVYQLIRVELLSFEFPPVAINFISDQARSRSIMVIPSQPAHHQRNAVRPVLTNEL